MENTTHDEARYLQDKSTLENKNLNINTYNCTLKDLKILNILPENYEKWKEEKKTKLKDIYEIYHKYFHIEDTDRIDIVLAVALSIKLEGIPLWLILVGSSGDMKSVQLNSLNNQDTFILHNLTSKTLVNGYKNKNKFPDLAPELNDKLVIIPDMAQILKLPPIEKGELWGQLRDLYDGLAGKISGQGCRARYENLKVTLLAGSTPSIDGQILVHQDLGTRELIYRTYGTVDKKKAMSRCFINEEFEKQIKSELNKKTTEFLKEREINRFELDEVQLNILMNIATYISYMRATAESDSFTNELRNEVYPEEPTRIAKQLKRLYICLMNLENEYDSKKAFKILWHIAKSSSFPLRIKIFEYLFKKESEESLSEISDRLHIGKSTVKRELNVFWNMRLVECRREIINSNNPDRTYDYWKINLNHPFIKELKNRPTV